MNHIFSIFWMMIKIRSIITRTQTLHTNWYWTENPSVGLPLHWLFKNFHALLTWTSAGMICTASFQCAQHLQHTLDKMTTWKILWSLFYIYHHYHDVSTCIYHKHTALWVWLGWFPFSSNTWRWHIMEKVFRLGIAKGKGMSEQVKDKMLSTESTMMA